MPTVAVRCAKAGLVERDRSPGECVKQYDGTTVVLAGKLVIAGMGAGDGRVGPAESGDEAHR